jgi:nitrous oxidase accessory protein
MFKITSTLLILFMMTLQANVLQEAIDSAPSGSIIKLPAGVYKGSIVIDKPLTIIGKESGVVIDGEGKGTVIKIKSSFVTLKNLKIVGSGDRHENIDAAVTITEAKQCEVSYCIIEDCLFGIDMQMTRNSIISNNTITSKDFELGLKGDGLRLWYSNDNIIKKIHLFVLVIWLFGIAMEIL